MGILAQREAETAVVQVGTVDKPHSSNETYRTQHADGREVPDGVVSVLLQHRKSYRIRQGNGGHEEGHAKGIECYEE